MIATLFRGTFDEKKQELNVCVFDDEPSEVKGGMYCEGWWPRFVFRVVKVGIVLGLLGVIGGVGWWYVRMERIEKEGETAVARLEEAGIFADVNDVLASYRELNGKENGVAYYGEVIRELRDYASPEQEVDGFEYVYLKDGEANIKRLKAFGELPFIKGTATDWRIVGKKPPAELIENAKRFMEAKGELIEKLKTGKVYEKYAWEMELTPSGGLECKDENAIVCALNIARLGHWIAVHEGDGESAIQWLETMRKLIDMTENMPQFYCFRYTMNLKLMVREIERGINLHAYDETQLNKIKLLLEEFDSESMLKQNYGLDVGFKDFKAGVEMVRIAIVLEHGRSGHGEEIAFGLRVEGPIGIEGETTVFASLRDEFARLAALETIAGGPVKMFEIDGIFSPMANSYFCEIDEDSSLGISGEISGKDFLCGLFWTWRRCVGEDVTKMEVAMTPAIDWAIVPDFDPFRQFFAYFFENFVPTFFFRKVVGFEVFA